MSDYPIMFSVRDTVVGNGFLAGVTVSGRLLVRQEDDGRWWVHGVRPSGISAAGATQEEAFMRFRETYKNVLFDLAEDAEKFDDFRNAVDSLYYQRNEIEEECWDLAFKSIRKEGTPTEGYFSTLPQQAPETRPTQCSVERLDQQTQTRYKATDNVPDYYALPTAA